MSGWIKMRTCLSRTPEVYQLARETGLDRFAVVGRLLEVWAWFDTMTEDGNAVGVTFVTLDDVACNAGFSQAMSNCGWLIETEAGLSVPKFEKHNSETAKKRANTANRVARHRAKNEKPTPNSAVTLDEKNVTPTALPRIEKRREEKECTPIPPRGRTDSSTLFDLPTTPGTAKVAPPAKAEVANLFEILWEMCPTKKGRGAAQKAWARVVRCHDPRDIVRRLTRYLACEQERYSARPDDYQALHLSTWLNQERFLDEPTRVPVPPARLLQSAWVASGRNGSGPPKWEVLAQQPEVVADMQRSSLAFNLFLEGLEECVRIVYPNAEIV
jgi:hypothetical protein